MKTRLTPTQTEIVKLMQSGWQLAKSMGADSREWIQEGGAGLGGKTKRVRAGTASALVTKGWAKPDKYSFPTMTYALVPVEGGA